MTSGTKLIADERGAAGKAFLIFLGAVVLVGVAGYALWKPVLLPLVGEAIPERMESDTSFVVPAESPAITLNVPKDWVAQRGLFNKEKAMVQSPDLVLQIEIETWPGGKAPSLEGAMAEVSENYVDTEEPRIEVLKEGVVFYYTFANGSEALIGAVGPDAGEDTSAKASALLTATVTGEEIENYLPTLSMFFSEMKIQ
ncbi:MAG TPA: hypothetical protein VLZ31_03430 [Microbacteriaceae bacterium]|nr:hypothetical protein [Microbacteriaceae bacterium]